MSTTAAIDELSDDERQGLELINDSGGIHQSEFWKELGFSSRKGSRIVSSLLEADLINREETVYEGQRTSCVEKQVIRYRVLKYLLSRRY